MRLTPKIYYVPGMISLVILPLILIQYLHLPQEQTVISLRIPNDRMYDKGSLITFSKGYILQSIQNKKQTLICLDSDHEMNLKKLEFIRREAQRLKFTNDTSEILKITFSDESNLHELVRLFDIMLMDEQKRYTLLGHNFYVFGEPRPEPEKTISISSFWGNDVILLTPEYSWKELFMTWFQKNLISIKWGALLASGYILLILIPNLMKLKRTHMSPSSAKEK